MNVITIYRFVGICAVLLLFGIIYAIYIAIKPFKPKFTWASVVIGDLATDLGSGAILWLFTGDLFLAALPFICHGLTGGPMIVGQITKHIFQDSGEIVVEDADKEQA